MGHSSSFCESTQFYCYSLDNATEADEHDIMAFSPLDPKGAGLVTYLQRLAFPDEDAGLMRTYLVRDKDTDELVGYFSLKAGLMTQEESGEDGIVELDTLPGVELANFAVNRTYRDSHPITKGCGRSIFQKLVLECVRRAAAIVGVSVVYLFSLPDQKVIENYQSYGFSRLESSDEDRIHARLKPRYDAQCVFMYMML